MWAHAEVSKSGTAAVIRKAALALGRSLSTVSVLVHLHAFQNQPETLLLWRTPSRVILLMSTAVTEALSPSSKHLQHTELLLEHSEVFQGLQHNFDISAGPTWEQMCGSSLSPTASQGHPHCPASAGCMPHALPLGEGTDPVRLFPVGVACVLYSESQKSAVTWTCTNIPCQCKSVPWGA